MGNCLACLKSEPNKQTDVNGPETATLEIPDGGAVGLAVSPELAQRSGNTYILNNLNKKN